MLKTVLNELAGKWRKLNGINLLLPNAVEDLGFFLGEEVLYLVPTSSNPNRNNPNERIPSKKTPRTFSPQINNAIWDSQSVQ